MAVPATSEVLPTTDGGASVLGFYRAFNLRNLERLGDFITDDCIYEDLLLGQVTVISGKRKLLDTLRFHPAFCSVRLAEYGLEWLAGMVPDISLQVLSLTEGDGVVGVEWQVRGLASLQLLTSSAASPPPTVVSHCLVASRCFVA